MSQRARVYLLVAVVLAATFGLIGASILRRPSSANGSSALPSNEVAPSGAPTGWAATVPSSLHAAFSVPVPAVDLNGPEVTGPDVTIDTYPGEITTVAGSPSGRTQDGVGGSAGFATMGGVAVWHGVGYVMTQGAVRTVDLKTGAVGTLAGSATETGCVEGAVGAAVRFEGLPASGAATDGTDVFVADGCGIADVTIASGATRFLTKWAGPLTLGPDAHIYAVAEMPAGPSASPGTIVRIDPVSGAHESYLTLPAGSYVLGLATDAISLWASVDEGPSAPTVLYQVKFSDASVTRYVAPGIDVVGAGQLVSAGRYLYAPSVGNLGVLQFDKNSGSWALVVGGFAGNLDGVWANTKFGYVRGLASDARSAIWVADDGNHTFRRLRINAAAALNLGVP
jgi:hypothetical protein